MDKKKLLQEHNDLVESLVEKTKFIYSEAFYSLDEFEKQKYVKDKMATEGHLSSLSALLWSKVPQIGGFADFLSLGLIGSMFGGNNWSSPSPTLPQAIDEKPFEEKRD